MPSSTTIPMVDLPGLITSAENRWRPALEQLLAHGPFILGSEVRRFEEGFAAATGARFAVGVGSGTSAIELCLRAAGIAPGSEVITSALTSPFTAQAIHAAGLRPRFADIEHDTLQISAESAARAINRHTRAIVAVHLYGQPCRLHAIARLAADHGLILVQDACQAHGARYRGRPFTDFSAFVAYSFYPTKNLGALGDGGAVATSRRSVYRRVAELRDGARRGGQVSYSPALNSRLDELQAIFLNAFLPQLTQWNAERIRLASLYDQYLAGCPGITLVKRYPCSVSHLYAVRARRRDRLRQALAGAGIATGIHYPKPLHLHPAFRSPRPARLPVAEAACREIVSLPLYPGLSEAQAAFVAARVRAFYEEKVA